MSTQRKRQKQEEAQKRKARRKSRSAEEQLHELDKRFGINQGAHKERHRLVDEINKAYAKDTKNLSKRRAEPKHNH